jgi:hypothetical protein
MKGAAMEPIPNSADAASRAKEARPPAPWWRFGMVWLVLAGPALAVVAGFTTLAIAFRHADAVVAQAPARGAAPLAGPTVPALQARNHAATPPRAPATP